MKAFYQWIIGKLLGDSRAVPAGEFRMKAGLYEGWSSIWINTLLFFLKLGLGILANSMSLIADAVHSATDSITSAIVIISFKISAKPADKEHPYGHGRAEIIATLIIALLIIVTGLEFIKSGLDRLLHPIELEMNLWIILAVVLTVFVKEALGQFSSELGKMVGSAALEADSWHHRSDALSSLVVIVAMIAAPLGFPWADGLGALIVAGFLMGVGIKLSRNTVDDLLGKAPSPEMIRDIRQLITTVPGVENAHDIVVHQYGSEFHIALHVEISAVIPPLEAHEMVESVERLIRKNLGAYSTIHYDPLPVNDTRVPPVRRIIENLQKELPEILGVNDLRIVDTHGTARLMMDLVTGYSPDSTAAKSVTESVISAIGQQFPNYDIRIYLTPLHKAR